MALLPLALKACYSLQTCTGIIKTRSGIRTAGIRYYTIGHLLCFVVRYQNEYLGNYPRCLVIFGLVAQVAVCLLG